MFAIIETGGKQYKVAKDTKVQVEKLDAEVGAKVEFDALMVQNDSGEIKVGAPNTGVKVVAEVTRQGRGDKLIVFRYKPKKRVRRKLGHRQPFTELKVVSIG